MGACKKKTAGRSVALWWLALIVALTVFGPRAEASYFIHAGSFRSPEYAEQAVTNFRSRGYQAFSRYESVPGRGMWHRVYIGEFPTSGEANQVGRNLESRGVVSYFSVVPSKASTTLKPQRTSGVAMQTSRPAQPYLPPTQAQPQQAIPPNQAGPLPAPQPSQDPFANLPPDVMNQLNAPQQQPPPNQLYPQPAPRPQPQAYPPQQQYPVETYPAPQPYCPPAEAPVSWGPPSMGPFTMFFKTGITFWPSADDFAAFRTTGAVTETFTVSGPAFHLALEPSVRVWEWLSVDGGVEKEVAGGINSWFFRTGPRATFELPSNWAPYLKTGFVYGLLDWDNPGDFDNGFGWDAGFGMDYMLEHLRFGFEFLYRGISFDYNTPAGMTSRSGSLDLSGFTLSGSFGYNF